MKNYLAFNNLQKDDLKDKYLYNGMAKSIISAQNVKIKDNKKDVITYIKPLGLPSNKLVSIMILIDNNAIKDMLSPLINKDSYTYIMNAKGEMISNYSSKDVITENIPRDKNQGYYYTSKDNKKLLVTYTKSELNNWVYVTMQPETNIFGYIKDFEKSNYLILFLVLIIGIVISYCFSLYETKPIVSLTSYIYENMKRNRGNNVDDFQYIHNSFEQLYEDTTNMQQKLSEQKPLVVQAFLERLIKGKFISESEIKAYSNYIQVQLDSPYYVVIVMNIVTYYDKFTHEILKELDQKKVIIKEIINNISDININLYDMDENKIAMLWCLSSNDQNFVRKYLTIIKDKISKQILIDDNVNVAFYIGEMCSNLLEITNSYEQAKTLIKYYKPEKDYIWYDKKDPNLLDKFYYYPYEIEERLKNAMMLGEEQVVRKILNDLYRKNFENENLSKHFLNLFLFDLIGTYLKFLEENKIYNSSIDDIINNWNNYSDIIIHQKIVKMFFESCRIIKEGKIEQLQNIIEKVTYYIKENYSNADLSLKLLSSKFNLSTAYLCQIFKEETKENFSGYLENIRMDKARVLLTQSKLPIKYIAIEIGNNTSNTFCRAFKRINGISATEYRDKFKKDINISSAD